MKRVRDTRCFWPRINFGNGHKLKLTCPLKIRNENDVFWAMKNKNRRVSRSFLFRMRETFIFLRLSVRIDFDGCSKALYDSNYIKNEGMNTMKLALSENALGKIPGYLNK